MDIINQAKQKREEYISKTQVFIEEFHHELEEYCFEIMKYSTSFSAIIFFRNVYNVTNLDDAVVIGTIETGGFGSGLKTRQWSVSKKRAIENYGDSFDGQTTVHLLENSLKTKCKAQESGSQYSIAPANFPPNTISRYQTWRIEQDAKVVDGHSSIIKSKEDEKLQRQEDLKTYKMMLAALGSSFDSLVTKLFNVLVNEKLPKLALQYEIVEIKIDAVEKRVIIREDHGTHNYIDSIPFPDEAVKILECKPDVTSCDYKRGVFAEELKQCLAVSTHGEALWEDGWFDQDFVLSWKTDAKLFSTRNNLYQIHQTEKQRRKDFEERRKVELVEEFSVLFAKHLKNKEQVRTDIKVRFGEFLAGFITKGCSSVTITVDNIVIWGTGRGHAPLTISNTIAFTMLLPLYPQEEMVEFSKKGIYALHAVITALNRDFLPLIMEVIKSEFGQYYSHISCKTFTMTF